MGVVGVRIHCCIFVCVLLSLYLSATTLSPSWHWQKQQLGPLHTLYDLHLIILSLQCKRWKLLPLQWSVSHLSYKKWLNPLPHGVFCGTQPMAWGLFGRTELMTSVLTTTLTLMTSCRANWPNASRWAILLGLFLEESRKHGWLQDFLTMVWSNSGNCLLPNTSQSDAVSVTSSGFHPKHAPLLLHPPSHLPQVLCASHTEIQKSEYYCMAVLEMKPFIQATWSYHMISRTLTEDSILLENLKSVQNKLQYHSKVHLKPENHTSKTGWILAKNFPILLTLFRIPVKIK